MNKIRLYIPLLLTLLLPSCELYMDQLEMPATTDTDAPDPKKELVTEDYNGAKISYSYTEETVELTEQYDKYIIANKNDSILYFREDTPNSFLPKPGDVLFSEGRDAYPNGLVRKVNEVKKENGMFGVYTQQAECQDLLSDFNIDMSDYEYPTYELVNYADPSEQMMVRKPEASRAEGDIKEIDGVTFICMATFELHLNFDDKYDFSKHFSGTTTGDITITLEQWQAEFDDALDIYKGNIAKRCISIFVLKIDGKGSISGSASWKPFEGLFDKLASKTTKGKVGGIFYPDLTISLTASAQLDGTITRTWVCDTRTSINDCDLNEKSEMRWIDNMYGAGTTKDITVSGSIKLSLDLEVRFGLSLFCGIIEAGGYVKGEASVSVNFDIIEFGTSEKPEPITMPLGEYKRTYQPRNDDNLKVNLEINGLGIYARVGTPYILMETVDKIAKAFELNPKTSVQFSFNDFISVRAVGGRAEVFLYINFVELCKHLGFTTSNPIVWHFFPDLNSKKSYIYCQNVNIFDRTSNHIIGKLYFDDPGLANYEQLELVVFDSKDRYVTSVPLEDGVITAQKNNKPYGYDIEVDIPLVWDLDYDSDYFKIYPCYRVKSLTPLASNAPGEQFWGFHCDREFMVKNYRPCVVMRKVHQNLFYMDEDEDARYYGVRCYWHITSSPEIKDWGMLLFTSKERKDITEENMKKCTKVGAYILQPDENGNRSYMNGDGFTSIDFEIKARYRSLDNYFLYILPFYIHPRTETPIVIYSDAMYMTLHDNENLQKIYHADFDELADQNFTMDR